jgi:hypothetical protein
VELQSRVHARQDHREHCMNPIGVNIDTELLLRAVGFVHSGEQLHRKRKRDDVKCEPKGDIFCTHSVSRNEIDMKFDVDAPSRLDLWPLLKQSHHVKNAIQSQSKDAIKAHQKAKLRLLQNHSDSNQKEKKEQQRLLSKIKQLDVRETAIKKKQEEIKAVVLSPTAPPGVVPTTVEDSLEPPVTLTRKQIKRRDTAFKGQLERVAKQKKEVVQKLQAVEAILASLPQNQNKNQAIIYDNHPSLQRYEARVEPDKWSGRMIRSVLVRALKSLLQSEYHLSIKTNRGSTKLESKRLRMSQEFWKPFWDQLGGHTVVRTDTEEGPMCCLCGAQPAAYQCEHCENQKLCNDCDKSRHSADSKHTRIGLSKYGLTFYPDCIRPTLAERMAAPQRDQVQSTSAIASIASETMLPTRTLSPKAKEVDEVQRQPKRQKRITTTYFLFGSDTETPAVTPLISSTIHSARHYMHHKNEPTIPPSPPPSPSPCANEMDCESC